MKKTLRIAQVTGVVVGLFGLWMLVPMQYAVMQQKRALAATPSVTIPAIAPVPVPSVVSGHPVRVQIPSLGIDVAVYDGTYNQKTGEWTLRDTDAQYALPSSLPNDTTGNTLIYGHYNGKVFQELHRVETGAEAYVLTAEGQKFVYTFMSSQVMSPTDTSVFLYDGPPRLTLQTCTGRYMQNRHMHYFAFDHYEVLTDQVN